MSGQGWRPIESAPKNGTHVLLLVALGAQVGVYEEDQDTRFFPPKLFGRWHSIPGMWTLHPTHWCPLPDPLTAK